MDTSNPPQVAREPLESVLGYLNFSSGAFDPQLHVHLNTLYGLVPEPIPGRDGGLLGGTSRQSPGRHTIVLQWLTRTLAELRGNSEAFQESAQAEAVLQAARELPGDYADFHRDLLFHQSLDHLFNPFMLGRVFEALLEQGPPWDDRPKRITGAIARLNDFIGYRPVPTLQWQRIEPRKHEWIRPIPLYLRQAGVASGCYADLVRRAVEILADTDAAILRAVWFDPRHLDELALDPRAYDFDHPVNKRPNYHFGEWDPHCIDNKGQYRRFIIREVTLQALMSRIDKSATLRIPRDELLHEAATVLAGTILMSSAITGSGPDTHDSSVTLGKLVIRIADSRDRYYEGRIQRVASPHAERLRREATLLQQPFGGARQYLNMYLSQQRASQLEHVRLARVFARMGYLNAAQRQADAIPVAAARISCRIDCGLTACDHALQSGERETVLENIERIVDLLHRGIECGALVDPWNILGFDSHFSLFPALENSVHDHRVDELLQIMDRLFSVLARLWSDAAAMSDIPVLARVETQYEELANWWHQFATHEVSSSETESPLAGLQAARSVASALGEWQKAGAATGDVSFWAPHVSSFQSAKPYALVLDTLLSREDYVSSLSLLVHWVEHADEIPLERRGTSFHEHMIQWIRGVCDHLCPHPHPHPHRQVVAENRDSPQPRASPSASVLLCKFFDFLEANAGQLWQVPHFQGLVSGNGPRPRNEIAEQAEPTDDDDDDSAARDLYGAAYEDVVYRDSTDDGVESQIFDPQARSASEESWEQEVEALQVRLLFLFTLGRAWLNASQALGRFAVTCDSLRESGELERLVGSLTEWKAQAVSNRQELLALQEAVHAHRVRRDGTNVDAMASFDRQRILKETVLEQITLTCVKTAMAELSLDAALSVITRRGLEHVPPPGDSDDESAIDAELEFASAILADALRKDRTSAIERCELLCEYLQRQEILYTPIARGGAPRTVTTTRIRQEYLRALLVALPRLGLVRQTLDLVETIRKMEHNIPTGSGAITQFDDLFETAYRELVEVLVRGTSQSRTRFAESDEDADSILVSCLEQLTENALASWLQHSQTLRLSVVERVRGGPAWKSLVDFIVRYGEDLFTQEFLFLGNIRAILHCGTENWLRELTQSDDPEHDYRLLHDLNRRISLAEAAAHLTVILEAIAESYDEYRDYNSTTTQSDRGDKLHILLDFLRLRSEYDRVAWNLRPVILSHRMLVRSGRTEAAQIWRRILHERLGTEADRYQKKLARLQKKHAVSMGTVAQRIGERFLQPMTIDRMQALVAPAIDELRRGVAGHAFEILEDEANLLMRDPLGGGVSVPKWLLALEEEIEELDRGHESGSEFRDDDPWTFEACEVSLEELQSQLAVDEDSP